MTKVTRLTDIQLILLTAAAARDTGSLLPPPSTLGDALSRIGKDISSLIRRGLAQEIEVAPGADAWRTEGNREMGVIITDAGRAAIGIEVISTLREVAESQVSDGDLLFFGADTEPVVNDALGALRVRLGHDLGQVEDGWQPLWMVDFPLVERDRESGRWQSTHHPFTAPRDEDVELLEHDPGAVRARAYDMVLNGTEIGGGSIRIHRPELQESVFQMLGIERDEVKRKFGFLLEALRYGAPPHGGIAFGLDRIVSMMAGEDSIREVIAFPKTQKSACLMTEAPSSIEHDQLRELGIRVRSTAGAVERAG